MVLRKQSQHEILMSKLVTANEAAHEVRTKTPDNFSVMVNMIHKTPTDTETK
jgi:hypothetical protein